MARKYKQRKIMKKDWVTEQLDKYYSSKGIASSIRKTPVDWSRYNPEVDPTPIYERYKIRQFTSKEQFRSYYLEKGLVDDRVNLKERERLLTKMWNDYVKREQLIITGQYEDIRTQIFKENYIKALTAIGVPQYYIDKLQSATLEEWSKIANVPNPDKSSTEDKKLPHLGGFAYSTKGDQERSYDMEKILTDVVKAAKDAGITLYTPEEYRSVVQDEESAQLADELDREYNQEVVRLKQVIRIIPKQIRSTVYDTFTAEELYDRAIANVTPRTKEGKKRVRKSKSGNLYIPFIGSQRSAQTRQLVSDIITEFERRGLSLSDIVEGWDEV